MKRFNKIKESKFEKLTPAEMGAVKGGLCISCKKRARKVEVGVFEGAKDTTEQENIDFNKAIHSHIEKQTK